MRSDNNVTEVVVPVLTPTYQILLDLVQRMKNINFKSQNVKVVGGKDVGQFIAELLEQKAFTDVMMELHFMLKDLEDELDKDVEKVLNG